MVLLCWIKECCNLVYKIDKTRDALEEASALFILPPKKMNNKIHYIWLLAQ